MQNEICIKHNIKSKWMASCEDEVLSMMIVENQPLCKMRKNQLPVFGFHKLIGHKSNQQQYPVSYIILELDTPKLLKQKIQNGCKETFEIIKAKFWIWYTKFKLDVDLQYYWMYLTPSTCGLRFVLKLDRGVQNEAEYKEVVKSFLRILYKKTNGAINQNHFDLLINQSWFVPTFSNYFDNKEMEYSITWLEKTKKLQSPKRQPIYILPKSNCSNEVVLQALKLTKNKLTYILGQRNKFIFLFACNCNRYGILEATALDFAKTNFDLEIIEIENSIKSAYRNNPYEFAKYLKAQTK